MKRLIRSRSAKIVLALLGCGGLLIATVASVDQMNPIGIVAPLPQGDVVMRYVVRWYDEDLKCWRESSIEVLRPQRLHPTEQIRDTHAWHPYQDTH